MKLLAFLLGIAVGAFGLNYYYTLHPEDAPGASSGVVTHVKDASTRKLSEWHLTGPEIKEELARSGHIVRTKAEAAGHSIASALTNTRIVAVINAKITLDKELASRNIHVDCDKDVVTLTGTVPTTAQLSKAVALALDTEGVAQVSSFLVVQPSAESKRDE